MATAPTAATHPWASAHRLVLTVSAIAVALAVAIVVTLLVMGVFSADVAGSTAPLDVVEDSCFGAPANTPC